MEKNHYETLGVSRSATTDEIKAAFRKLSKTTHPDVAGVGNTQRFQVISNAASVLTDKAKREAYDVYLRGGHGPISTPPSSFRRGPRVHNFNASSGFEEALQGILRPRNLMYGAIGMFVFGTVVRYFESADNDKAITNSQYLPPNRRISKNLVQAWMNPVTRQWEQPAPWDPTYRRLRPKLELIPRDQVKYRSR